MIEDKNIFEMAGIEINEDTDFETLLSDFLKAYSERIDSEIRNTEVKDSE
jgi:hypothetical protein